MSTGWKTINLLLGGFSIVWAPVIFWFINTPENVRWLTAAQKLQLKARLVEGKGNSNEVHTFDWSQAAECAKDPQVSSLTIELSSANSNYARQVYAFVLITFLGSFANSGITTFGGLICTRDVKYSEGFTDEVLSDWPGSIQSASDILPNSRMGRWVYLHQCHRLRQLQVQERPRTHNATFYGHILRLASSATAVASLGSESTPPASCCSQLCQSIGTGRNSESTP